MKGLRASRWIAPAGGRASLLAAALITAALIPTFVVQGCTGCSAFSSGGLPQAALRDSPDAWIVVWFVGIIAATGVLFLAGVAARVVTVINVVASGAALSLAIFEGAVAFPRVLAAAELVPGVPVTHVLGPGYYLFLTGAVVAVAGAAAMWLSAGGRDGAIVTRAPHGPRVVVAVACTCLISLGLALLGAFLPFGDLRCGFGCPPVFEPASAYSSAIVAGTDGWIVVALIVIAALGIGVRVTGRRKPVATVTTLLLSGTATAVISFDSLNGATRILGWPYAIPTSPGPGYYLLQAGTAIAAVLALVLAVDDHPGLGVRRHTGRQARAVVDQAR